METVGTLNINNHNIAYVFNDAGSKNLVIFCHGFRGTSIGPSRTFVRATRKLSKIGISSLRFDQYGCGNSDGDFKDSSFNDWIDTTSEIVKEYQAKGYRVALFGQSMGGSTVLIAGSQNKKVVSIVAWVPAAQVVNFTPPKSGFMEEAGQVVQSDFWKESHDANIIHYLREIDSPLYIVQCSDDEYITKEDHKAIIENVKQNHKIEMYEGYKHSTWTYDQANEIIDKSIEFIKKSFK
jgi:alpha-beta hydrolase superfamily lysophospholipase